MNSRTFVFQGLLFAVLLLISSVVAEQTSKEEINEVEAKEPNQQYGGGKQCPSGCCGYGPYGRCRWCCRNVAEAQAFEKGYGEGAYYGRGGGWGGGGRGGGWGGGGGGRCCGEVDGDAQSKENEAKRP